jgi:hypothetical protein
MGSVCLTFRTIQNPVLRLPAMNAKGVTPILNVSDMAAVPQTHPRTQTARFAWFAKWGWRKLWDWMC